MNARCAPFLALVIWYLLAPPLNDSHQPPPPQSDADGLFLSTAPPRAAEHKLDVPLSAWHPRGVFDSQEDCDKARSSAINDSEQAVQRCEALINSAHYNSDQPGRSAIAPDLRSRLQRLQSDYKNLIFAKCVAAADPRLEEK